nr:HAD hydrolase-like protein [Bacteroidota bacterium]
KKSIMVGDSISDMEFGNNLGMVTIFISDETKVPAETNIDIMVKSLTEFVSKIEN